MQMDMLDDGLLETELSVEEAEVMEHGCLTLAEVIERDRIAKQPSQPFSVKQLAKMKLRFDLVIQRNLKWTEKDATYLIESIFLGYPIPPVYVLKSNDKSLWFLDGKQRGSWLTSFVKGEWSLTECIVFGVNVTGLKYQELPEELRELIDTQFINVYQFEKLTVNQRDQLFKRLNSGVPLSKIEIIRSILGTEWLDYINSLIETPFIRKMGITPKQQEGFKDQEMIMQMMSIITGKSYDVGSKDVEDFAINLRINGMSDEDKSLIDKTFKYLSDAFREVVDKTAKKVLKKSNVIRITGAAVDAVDKPELFGDIISTYIANQKSGSPFSSTTRSKSASADSVKKGIEILKGILIVEKQQSA